MSYKFISMASEYTTEGFNPVADSIKMLPTRTNNVCKLCAHQIVLLLTQFTRTITTHIFMVCMMCASHLMAHICLSPTTRMDALWYSTLRTIILSMLSNFFTVRQ